MTQKKENSGEIIGFMRNDKARDMWDIIVRDENAKQVVATIHKDLLKKGIMCGDALWKICPNSKK